MADRKKIGTGLIGSGSTGKTDAPGFAIAPRAFDLPFGVDVVTLADDDAGSRGLSHDLRGTRA